MVWARSLHADISNGRSRRQCALGALLAGALAQGGLLTEAMDTISEGSSEYQFAINGLALIVAAVKFPAGILGGRAPRRSAARSTQPTEMVAS